MSANECDFCNAPRPPWRYTAVPYGMAGVAPDGRVVPVASSDETWFACDACKRLVDAGDFEAFTANAMNAMRRILKERGGVYAAIPENAWQATVKVMREAHRVFWLTRQGPVRVRGVGKFGESVGRDDE